MRLERAAALTSGAGLLFQFHKGAIRTAKTYIRTIEERYFNSIKVRLEQLDHHQKDFGLRYFNSIKVRLELMSAEIGAAALTSFQFHKGAIRTTYEDMNSGLNPLISIP